MPSSPARPGRTWLAQLAASAHFDGTSAAKTVNLNFGLGVNTEIDANAAIGVTGSITIVWAHLGDV